MISAQEKKEEDERKRKDFREKEREEERKNMKKDIEKKKINKNVNEDIKIEYMGAFKNEEPATIEKPKEEFYVNKVKSKTETQRKDEDNKPYELDKKTRLTREQLKQMKVFYK